MRFDKRPRADGGALTGVVNTVLATQGSRSSPAMVPKKCNHGSGRKLLTNGKNRSILIKNKFQKKAAEVESGSREVLKIKLCSKALGFQLD